MKSQFCRLLGFFPLSGFAVSLFKFSLLFYLFILFSTDSAYSQIQSSKKDTSIQIYPSSFSQVEVYFSRGEMISNVLSVRNKSNDTIRFTIDLTYPFEWKTLLSPHKIFEINPGDSLFIPVRLLPGRVLKGNTKYFINAFLINQDGKRLGNSFFFAFTQKIIKWTLDIAPDRRNYFLNNVNTSRFSVSLANLGNEDQDILLGFRDVSYNATILDTSEKEIKKKTFNIMLEAGRDTTFNYIFSYYKKPLNFSKVDLEYYNPFSIEESKTYSLHAISSLPRLLPNGADFRVGKKMEFVKLSDILTVNPYNGKVLPLTVDANIYNILSGVPIMATNLRGNTILRNDARLFYNALLMYTTNIYTNNAYINAPFYIGYYQNKLNVTIGSNSTSKGIWSEYRFSKTHRIKSYYKQGSGLFSNINYFNAGVNYSYVIPFSTKWVSGIGINADYDHSTYFPLKINTERVIAGVSGTIFNKVFLGVSFFEHIQRNKTTDTTQIMPGYIINIGYNDNFFKNKLNSSIGASYHSDNGAYYYSGYSSYYSSNFSDRNSYNVTLKNEYSFKNDRKLSLNNSYSSYPIYYNGTTHYRNDEYLNYLSYIPINKSVNVYSSLFYNVYKNEDFISHSRGINASISKYVIEKNLRASYNITSGYNRSVSSPDQNDYFFFYSSLLTQYRTYTFSSYYTYGYSRMSRYLMATLNNYPQKISFYVQHQYVFPYPAFVLESKVGYSYSNITGHSFVVTPDLYFFTRNGWRFRLTPELYLSKTNPVTQTKESYYFSSTREVESVLPSWNKYLGLTFGIKKDFGIPIPWSKPLYATTDFLVFMDLNGDKIYDKGEQLLENVVIRLNGFEVITNSQGKAKIENIELGSYPFYVFSLVDQQGWYPNEDDSLVVIKNDVKQIPFSKGIMVHGGIVLDREKYAANNDAPLDLSRIKISANNGKVISAITDKNGNYSMYLPYGKFILTLDENVLGDRFYLVENNYELTLDEKVDNLYIPFYIVEKKRKITIKKFDNGTEDSPDIKKKKEAEEKLKKEEEERKKKEELKNKKMTPAEKKKLEELEKKKKLEEEKLKKAELEKQKKLDADKKKQDELNKINKAKADSLKNASGDNDLKKNKDGVIDLTSKGEVDTNDIKNLTDAILNKISGKNNKTDKKETKKETKKEDKKETKKEDKKEEKKEDYQAKNVSDLKNLNRKINKDDFLDIEIEGLLYRVQVAASNAEVPTSWLKNQFNIKSDVYLFKNDDGMYNYCLGDFPTKGEATKYNEKLAFQKKVNSFISYYYNNKRVPYKVIEQIYQSIIDQINEEKNANPQNDNLQKQQNDSLKQLLNDTIKLMKDTLNK